MSSGLRRTAKDLDKVFKALGRSAHVFTLTGEGGDAGEVDGGAGGGGAGGEERG